MTNFIFKSREDFHKINQQLKTILDNQRHLRNDINICSIKVSKIYNALALQKQVTDFYDSAESSENVSHPEDSRDLD